MAGARSERIVTIESRVRAVPPIDVFASIGPKKRLVTLSGAEGSISLDFASIDQMQAALDAAKRWLADKGTRDA